MQSNLTLILSSATNSLKCNFIFLQHPVGLNRSGFIYIIQKKREKEQRFAGMEVQHLGDVLVMVLKGLSCALCYSLLCYWLLRTPRSGCSFYLFIASTCLMISLRTNVTYADPRCLAVLVEHRINEWNSEKEWVDLDGLTWSAKVEMKSVARISLRPNPGNIQESSGSVLWVWKTPFLRLLFRSLEAMLLFKIFKTSSGRNSKFIHSFI